MVECKKINDKYIVTTPDGIEVDMDNVKLTVRLADTTTGEVLMILEDGTRLYMSKECSDSIIAAVAALKPPPDEYVCRNPCGETEPISFGFVNPFVQAHYMNMFRQKRGLPPYTNEELDLIRTSLTIQADEHDRLHNAVGCQTDQTNGSVRPEE